MLIRATTTRRCRYTVSGQLLSKELLMLSAIHVQDFSKKEPQKESSRIVGRGGWISMRVETIDLEVASSQCKLRMWTDVFSKTPDWIRVNLAWVH